MKTDITKYTYKKIFNGLLAVMILFFITVDLIFAWNRPRDVSQITWLINYFSYFTILSNLVLALSSGILAFYPDIKSIAFRALRVGSLVCILITAIVFNFVLRSTFHPASLTAIITNEMFHVVHPLLGFMVWFFWDTKPMVSMRVVRLAITPPLIYTAYVFVRGYFTGFYPYFFVNVKKVGIVMSSLSVIIIIALFYFICWVLFLLEKLVYKNR